MMFDRRLTNFLLIIAPGLLLFSGHAVAQQRPLKDQILGAWTLVTADKLNYGARYQAFGQDQKGIAIFDASGRYVFSFADPGVPKFAGGNRTGGSADENKAAMEGALSHFGTFSINENERSFTLKIDGSSFPNLTGTEEKQTFTLSSDDLKWTTPETPDGSTFEFAWKRAK